MNVLFGETWKQTNNTKETGNFETFSCIFKGIKLKLNGNIIVSMGEKKNRFIKGIEHEIIGNFNLKLLLLLLKLT